MPTPGLGEGNGLVEAWQLDPASALLHLAFWQGPGAEPPAGGWPASLEARWAKLHRSSVVLRLIGG